ncbi:MAG: glycosyltransferase family 39 protein [Thermoanaerobaculales bacterium]
MVADEDFVSEQFPWRRALWVVVGTAFVVRLWNLGSFSLWLDEVVTLRFASLPLAELLGACAGDAENVPLYAIIAFLASRAGLAEPWIRIPFIVLGTAGVAVLMLWVRERLGTTAGFVAGVFAAVSPFHVRYSQEMRAYPILLLVIPLCLLTAERIAEHPKWRPTVVLAVLVSVGAFTHLTFWIVIPALLAIAALPGRSTAPIADRMKLTSAAIGFGGLVFLPWAFAIRQNLMGRLDRGGSDWTLSQLGIRWHALTTAPWEGLQPTISSFVLLLVFLFGLVILIGNRNHRWIVLAGLGSLLAWEGALAAVGHWSDARYSLTLWFLIPLCVGAAAGWTSGKVKQTFITRILFPVILVVLIFPGMWRYWHEGRPHWDVIADSIRSVSHSGNPVVAANEWTRVCLPWYLKGRSILRPEALQDLTAQPVLVVTGGLMPSPLLESPQFNFESTVLRIPRTARLDRLARIPPANDGHPTWWPPISSLESVSLSVLPRPAPERWLIALRNQDSVHTEAVSLDLGSPIPLPSTGFGPARLRPDGVGFAWVIGQEAALILPPLAGRRLDISISLRPFHGVERGQQCRILVGNTVVVEQELRPGVQRIGASGVPNPAESKEQLLVLQFSAVARPIKVKPGSRDTRPLAAAVEKIEFRGHSGDP